MIQAPSASVPTSSRAAPRPNLLIGASTALEPYQPAPDEPYMSPGQYDYFRSILQAWRDELLEEANRSVSSIKDEPSANLPDDLDLASQEGGFDIEIRIRDRERQLISKIDKTIESIDRGFYGYCESCGVEIGLRRLEARVIATQCVDCKERDELREKQLHG